jgi:hypothetical protein
MFTSIQDAIGVVNQQDSSSNDYRLACEYLIDHRDELQQRIFIILPGGLGGNSDSEWEAVKSGSDERCSCGNERVITPLNPRTEFEAASVQLVIKPGKPVYLKPVGGDKISAYLCLEIKGEALTFFEDPFAPLVLTMDLFGTKGYELQQLADVLPGQPKPPVFKRVLGGTPVPIFAINAVDVGSNTVTITLDSAVEAFNPEEMTGHAC